MFIIKNVSNKRILIKDLGLLILQGEIKDLDLFFDRKITENSQYLKAALQKNEDPKENLLETIQKDEVSIIQNNVNIDQLIKDKINSLSNSNEQTTLSIEDVHKKMDILLTAIADLKNQPQQVIYQNTPNSIEKEEEKVDTTIDDQQIIDIHSRSIKRISKDVSGSVSTEETKKDSNIDDRVDELEGLI